MSYFDAYGEALNSAYEAQDQMAREIRSWVASKFTGKKRQPHRG